MVKPVRSTPPREGRQLASDRAAGVFNVSIHAPAALDECLALKPELGVLLEVYKARIERFIVAPPGRDWDGVHFDLSK